MKCKNCNRPIELRDGVWCHIDKNVWNELRYMQQCMVSTVAQPKK